MKSALLFISLLFLFAECKKIPEREFIQVKAVSVDGVALAEGQGIEVDYGDEADVVFEYTSNSPLTEAYVKMIVSHLQGIDSSDDANITNHPKAGDTGGKFTYRIKTESQFDPPIGNPVVDKKSIQVVMMNEVGTVEVYYISVLVK